MPAASPDVTSSIRMVAGLGNPGSRYEATRHNVGFMILDRLVERLPDPWKEEKKWETLLLRDGERFYLKPQTFMNSSGKAIAGVANFYKIDPEEILVVYDDADLPLGRLRFRASGSAGGHNGIKSIISSLGGERFPRLKVGIGRQEISPGSGIVKHVLGKFAPDEQESLEKCLQNAVSAIESALSHGLETAMNEFNRKEKPAKQPKTNPKTEETAAESAPEESGSPEAPPTNQDE